MEPRRSSRKRPAQCLLRTSCAEPSCPDFQVTYATGDFHFSGNTSGAGILIIEGSATFTGRFSFQGLVLVAGDVRMSGSGTEAKVLGGLMVGQSLTDDTTTTTGSGSMKVYYSSEALSRAEAAASKNYILFYDDN